MRKLCTLVSLTMSILLGSMSLVSAQPAKPVTIAAQLNSDIPQILLALDKNLWKDQGLEVKLIATASGREALEALVGGQADFVVLADLPATIAALRNQPFVILADLTRYKGQRAIASRKRMKRFDSPADLNGVKLGTTLGTSVEYLTALLLQRGNATAEIVNVTPADIVPALVRGDIDASVPCPSVYAQAKKLLGPDYMELIAKDYAAHILLAATPAMVKDRPADVEKFLRGVLKGDEMTASDPGAAKAAVIQAGKGVMTMEVLDTMWPDYEHRLVLKNDIVRFMGEEAAWVAKKGMIKIEPGKATAQTIRTFINEAPLAKLDPKRVEITAAK